jgi:diguanylate cyclase (GGDEF)-like protein
VAALFLDLDDFKTINDTLGHAAGDDALIAVSLRLRAALRNSDLAARLGGDEFGVLLQDIPDESHAIDVAGRLLESFSTPLVVANLAVTLGASIGIAVDAPGMETVDDLLAHADIAMYQAKAEGKGRYHVFRAPDGAATAADDQAGAPRGRTVRRRQPVAVAEPHPAPTAG